ncbi:MAG TPA: glycosyltransferase family 9 protein [Phycisphaerae bacterium]|nr:glycosyltransferase family 9 protein [Phycisphaerae bacterium]
MTNGEPGVASGKSPEGGWEPAKGDGAEPASTRLPPSAIRQCLFLHAGALGDFVLTLHVAAALRAAAPRARITMAARCPLAAFVVGRGPIDAAINLEQLGLHHLYGHEELPADLAERLGQYDLAINFLGGRRAHVSDRLRRSAGGAVLSVDPAWRAGDPVGHITAQWLADLERAGLALRAQPHFMLSPSAAERATARRKLVELVGKPSGPLVICQPGSGGRAKCCPLETLESAVGRLQDRGCGVVWMIGPTEMDWHGSGYRDRLSRVAPVIYEESIPAAAALLGGADAFVGNDAGMTHVAGALGLRTITLFGPTDPRIWQPLGPAVTVLGFSAASEPALLATDIAASVNQAG